MTDPTFVIAAYAIVLGGLAMYAVSIARRLAGARHTAEALERERRRAVTDTSSEAPVLDAPESTALQSPGGGR